MLPLTPPSPATRAKMQAQGRRDTAPELALRRELHRRRKRFFVDRAPVSRLRRRADLVFPRLRVAVFVDGCFWHSCPTHGRIPRSNRDWWQAKLSRNAARDRETDRRLHEQGWSVVRIWEHQPVQQAADQVEAVLTAAERRRARPPIP